MVKNVRTFAFNFWEMIAFWASSPAFLQGIRESARS
jgi:hypothetical protein